MRTESKTRSCAIALCCFMFMAGECFAADVHQLPISDCDNNCGDKATDGDAICDANCLEANWQWATDQNLIYCQMTLGNANFTPGSKAWASGSDQADSCSKCLSAPGSGTGSTSIATASSTSETATNSSSSTFGVSGKAAVNLWLIGKTEITASASYTSGSSSSTSVAKTDTRTCAQTVNPCHKVLSIRSMFKRTHNGSGTATLLGKFRCDASEGHTCNDTGQRYSNWFSAVFTTNPCVKDITLTGTAEVTDVKCTQCSIPCLSLDDACCAYSTGTQEQVNAAVEACEAESHTWP